MPVDLKEFDAFQRNFVKFASRGLVGKVAARAAIIAYRFLINNGPVFTGAYRSSHEILLNRRTVFRPPDMPSPNRRVPQIENTFQKPSIGEATNAVKSFSKEKVQNFTMQNRRFYAGLIEFGGGPHDGHFLYERAAREVEKRMPKVILREIDEVFTAVEKGSTLGEASQFET